MSFAVVELGLTEEQFWKLTPGQYQAMQDVFYERIKREDYRAGIIERIIRQVLGDKKADAFDSFPIHKPKKPVTKPTAKDRVAQLKAAQAAVKNRKVRRG